ncbi:MAG: hypothetical protein WC494_04035 [Candidatus Pacearchaeota archaeon]
MVKDLVSLAEGIALSGRKVSKRPYTPNTGFSVDFGDDCDCYGGDCSDCYCTDCNEGNDD